MEQTRAAMASPMLRKELRPRDTLLQAIPENPSPCDSQAPLISHMVDLGHRG